MRDLFQRLDPRARVLVIVSATAIMASTPPGVLLPFAAYLPLCGLVVLTGRAAASALAWRCLAASPFIVLAAGLLALQQGGSLDGIRAAAPAALSVAAKGYAAVLLLAFLTLSTPLSDLLAALRGLGAPKSFNLILGLMYRYTHLLAEEYRRMERARDSRSVRPLARRRVTLYGRPLGALILRSWDRAERVHAAMLARGFHGAWPTLRRPCWRALDTGALLAAFTLFLAARLLG